MVARGCIATIGGSKSALYFIIRSLCHCIGITLRGHERTGSWLMLNARFVCRMSYVINNFISMYDFPHILCNQIFYSQIQCIISGQVCKISNMVLLFSHMKLERSKTSKFKVFYKAEKSMKQD
jgi:hypothetical protein